MYFSRLVLLCAMLGSFACGMSAQTGCTDPEACNYDANAVTDDGSCASANAIVFGNPKAANLGAFGDVFDVAWVDGDFDGDLDALVMLIYLVDPTFGSSYDDSEIRYAENSGGTWNILSSNPVTDDLAWGEIVVDDFDADGQQEVLIAGTVSDNTNTRNYQLRDWNGSSWVTIASDTPLSVPNGAGNETAIAAGDFDGDGHLGFVMATAEEGMHFVQNTAGVFTDLTTGLEGINAWDVALGDMDGDGDDDLVISGLTNVEWFANNSGVFELTGTTIGAASNNSFVERRVSLELADFTGDGRDEVLYVDRFGTAFLYQNDTPAFTDLLNDATYYGGSGSCRFADVDGDGDPDAVIGGTSSRVYINDGGIPTDQGSSGLYLSSSRFDMGDGYGDPKPDWAGIGGSSSMLFLENQSSSLPQAVFGCIDPSACNFNSEADCDSGTCQYFDACGICGGSGTIAGCTDPAACNFNPSANCDDGTCLLIYGCTDDLACNYNAIAVCDDGTCLFADACAVCGGSGTVAGCMHDQACNYNPLADCDDGGCLYYDACGVCGGGGNLPGCTDILAVNYDALANCDNGSCVFDVTDPCPTDIDGDGTTSTGDLLAILGAFGAVCP